MNESKTMAKDPICGMTVNEATALRAEHVGQTHYFCSEHCRQKFIGQARSANAIPVTLTDTGSGCCGGAKAEAPSGSGDCCDGASGHEDHSHHEQDHDAPEHSCCGGKPSGDSHSHSHHEHGDVKPPAGAKYFCPMCPGVESDKPGDCPKCGMALERNPA